MGLLDDMLGGAGSKILGQMLATQGGQPGQTGGGVQVVQIAETVIGMLGSQQGGGLAGLVKTFTQAGLGQQVSSWVSTGANLPVSADQIKAALGNQQLQGMAQQLGLDHGALSGVLAQLLPQVINHLTPNGQVPPANELQQGLNALRQTLGK
jgi:uncharacterized protein YidB (DUF937 family)